MNTDFFTQLQRITADKHRETVGAVIADVVDLFGSNFDLTMEDYFTQLESMARMVRLSSKQHPELAAPVIRAKRDRLMKALAAVLEEATDVSKSDSKACERHVALVECLDPQDTIISFNYDCVVDHALRTEGSGKWSARHGYCFDKPSRIEGYEAWDSPDPPTRQQDSVYLLKLHGSINWQLPSAEKATDGTINLKQILYQQKGTPRFTIIPPEFVKDIENDLNFKTLWMKAERAIRGAETVVLVGFSFTPTDLHVDSLFRVALNGTHDLKRVVIANPSSEHRAKIREVFSRALVKNVVVRQYDYFEDLADALPGCLQ